MMRLNLGCCDRHLGGFLNVDRFPPADLLCDLEEPWPFADQSVSEIVAADVFEHLPDKLHTMNEAHRVLELGGVLRMLVPTTDGWAAFQDPTHVSFWTPNDLRYYESGKPERERFGAHYGISARFRVLHQNHREVTPRVWYLEAHLEAIH